MVINIINKTGKVIKNEKNDAAVSGGGVSYLNYHWEGDIRANIWRKDVRECSW